MTFTIRFEKSEKQGKRSLCRLCTSFWAKKIFFNCQLAILGEHDGESKKSGRGTDDLWVITKKERRWERWRGWGGERKEMKSAREKKNVPLINEKFVPVVSMALKLEWSIVQPRIVVILCGEVSKMWRNGEKLRNINANSVDAIWGPAWQIKFCAWKSTEV